MNISLTEANVVLEGALLAAQQLGVTVDVAVLDGGAHLKAFARMDGSWLASIDIALKKAKTSVLFESSTEEVREFSKPGAPAQWLEATNEGLVTFAGGLPLRDEAGEMIGAVGVSGGSVDQDRIVATAGAAALERARLLAAM